MDHMVWNQGRWKTYSTNDGLLIDEKGLVNDIVFDSSGNTWIATSLGVSCLNMKGIGRNFSIPDDGFSHLVSSLAIASDNTIWCGTLNGAYKLNCGKLQYEFEPVEQLIGNGVLDKTITVDRSIWFSTYDSVYCRKPK